MKSGPIKRHGGKAYLATKIRELFPPHTRYCETHFGGGAVLLAGDGEGVAEYANDIDKELSDFWMCLADVRQFADFARRVQAVPFSQYEFAAAVGNGEFCESRVATACRFFIRNRQSRQALGKDFATPTSRLRRGMNEQVSAWLTAVDGLPEFHARMRRVEVRNQDATKFIQELDSPETLFYCDPPYLHETRSTTGEYRHEMTFQQHHDLLVQLSAIKGKFILSGYRSELYDAISKSEEWRRVDFDLPNQASSAKVKERKTECCWMNYA